jgi:hypothetical protein
MKETREIQERMKDVFGLLARDKEVVVLYEGEEKAGQEDGKLPVEMKKERPAFFAGNLLQRVNRAVPSEGASADLGTTVRPSGLG